MKRYKTYMDAVEASPQFRRRLMELKAPQKAPIRRRYGALAAALALTLGLGIFGAARLSRGRAPLGQVSRPAAEARWEEPATEPAVVPVDGVPEWVEGEYNPMKGGYEVADGETASYFFLPWIRYGEKGAESAPSLAPPVGVERRELTQTEMEDLLGGEANLTAHLNWGGYEMAGHVMAYEDGTVWRAMVSGRADDGHFTLTMRPGALPQECCVVENREECVTRVWGVEVSGYYGGIYGEGADREVWLSESREVEFIAHGVGCRFAFYGPEGEAERVETMVARFVRLAVLEGLALDALTPGWEPPVETASPGGDGGARTMPHGPTA